MYINTYERICYLRCMRGWACQNYCCWNKQRSNFVIFVVPQRYPTTWPILDPCSTNYIYIVFVVFCIYIYIYACSFPYQYHNINGIMYIYICRYIYIIYIHICIILTPPHTRCFLPPLNSALSVDSHTTTSRRCRSRGPEPLWLPDGRITNSEIWWNLVNWVQK